MTVKVLVKAPMNVYTGYGMDGIGITRALLNAGCDVYLDPVQVSAPLPPDVAALFCKELTAPFDLIIHHVSPDLLGLTPQGRAATDITVGWTMWEYTTLDNLKGKTGLRKRLGTYDVVFGYDTVSTAALLPYMKDTKAGVLQGGFWPDDWRPMQRDWRGARFGFCMVGQLHQRKDPFVAIDAFRELKEEHPDEFAPAELHLKTNIPGLHSKLEEIIPKLRVHYASWPREVVRDFYGSQHVLLAPSRGEGKNLPALEFLSTGGTVIATDWGGHQQWLSSEYAYPLKYSLAPIGGGTPDCLNARADKEHLKYLMLHTFRNRAECEKKGRIGSELIPQMCSWDAVIERLFVKIADKVPGRGEALLHKFRRVKDMTVLGFPIHA